MNTTPEATPKPPPRIFCGDGCGANVADQKEAEDASWSWMSILGRYRCAKCGRELHAASFVKGADGQTPDTLAPEDPGALAKNRVHSSNARLADTIKAPDAGLKS